MRTWRYERCSVAVMIIWELVNEVVRKSTHVVRRSLEPGALSPGILVDTYDVKVYPNGEKVILSHTNRQDPSIIYSTPNQRQTLVLSRALPRQQPSFWYIHRCAPPQHCRQRECLNMHEIMMRTSE